MNIVIYHKTRIYLFNTKYWELLKYSFGEMPRKLAIIPGVKAKYADKSQVGWKKDKGGFSGQV